MRISKVSNQGMAEFDDGISAIVFFCGCDLDCPFCHNDKLIKLEDCPKNDYEAWEAAELIKLDMVDWVSLTGGEVLVQSDFGTVRNMIEYVKSKGKKVNIDTNGFIRNGSPKWKNLKSIAGMLDCISVDIKMQKVQTNTYLNMHTWLDGLRVRDKTRFRMVVLEEVSDVYFANHTMKFFKYNGIKRIELLPNSMLGRGVQFSRTSKELLGQIATFYSDNGISTGPTESLNTSNHTGARG